MLKLLTVIRNSLKKKKNNRHEAWIIIGLYDDAELQQFKFFSI